MCFGKALTFFCCDVFFLVSFSLHLQVQLEEKRILLQHECKKLTDKVMLLNNLYIGHDKLLRKTYIISKNF